MKNYKAVKALRDKTGAGLLICREAVQYGMSKPYDMEEWALAYVKAHGLAVATPGKTWEERVEMFYNNIVK